MQASDLLRVAFLGCLVAMPLAVVAAEPPVDTPMDFAAAKDAADADEASQDEAARAAARVRQGKFLDTGVAACADARTTAQLEGFVIVVELDSDGRVARTWRRGDSPLALCIERQARGKTMFVPPRTPFHASLEVGFTR
jgi:hypothetical protein